MMKQYPYVVLYKNHNTPIGLFAFKCKARDPDHAESKRLERCPHAIIIAVVETDNIEEAYRQYYAFDNISNKNIP